MKRGTVIACTSVMWNTGKQKRKRRSRRGSKSIDQPDEASGSGGNGTPSDKAAQRTLEPEIDQTVRQDCFNLRFLL